MANLFGNNSKKTSRIHNPKHQPEMLAHKVKYKNALQLAKDIGQLDKDGQRVLRLSMAHLFLVILLRLILLLIIY